MAQLQGYTGRTHSTLTESASENPFKKHREKFWKRMIFNLNKPVRD